MRVSQVVIEPVLRALIDREASVDLRLSTKFEALAQTDSGVSVVLRDMLTGKAETVTCRYLVGCDGGNSHARQELDISLNGKPRVMERFMTHFRSPERGLLQRWGIAWHYQSAYGTLIAQNDENIWTLHSRFPEGKPDEIDPRALLRRFIGRDIEAEILVANRWTPHLLVAEQYSRGHVFLAGDAAHQYIPTGGYGMNTGIGDANNLAWKLAAVLLGFAGEALLKSYDAERQPVGLRNCGAAALHNDVRRQIGTLYTDALYSNDPADRTARASAAAAIARLGNLENEAWGIEHGYVYASSNVICSEPGATYCMDPARYEPTTVPGARLPSVFLKCGTPLFDLLGPWLTLIAFGSHGDCAYFAAAAEARGVPLRILRLSEPEVAPIFQASLIVARPDQHVGWRGNRMHDMSMAGLVLDQLLGRALDGSPMPTSSRAFAQ